VTPKPRARLAYFFFVCVLAPLVHSSLDLCSLPEPTTTVVNIAASTLAKKKASDKASAPSDSSCYSHPTVLVDKKPVVFPINGPELLTKIPMHFFSSNPCAQTLHTVLSKPTFQASAVKASIVLEWERVPARLAESLASALEDGETAAIVAHAVLELHREKLGRSLLPLTHTTTLNVFTSTTTPAKHLRDIDSVHMMRPSEDSDVYVSLVDLGEVVGKSVVSGHRDVLFQSINHMQHPWGWDLMYPFYVLYCLQDFTLDCGSMMCGGKGRAWSDRWFDCVRKFLTPFGFRAIHEKKQLERTGTTENSFLLFVCWNTDLHSAMAKHAEHYLRPLYPKMVVR